MLNAQTYKNEMFFVNRSCWKCLRCCKRPRAHHYKISSLFESVSLEPVFFILKSTYSYFSEILLCRGICLFDNVVTSSQHSSDTLEFVMHVFKSSEQFQYVYIGRLSLRDPYKSLVSKCTLHSQILQYRQSISETLLLGYRKH